MTSKLFTFFLSSFLLLGLISATNAKTRNYEDQRGDYALELPLPTWRVVQVDGIAHPRTEFVNGRLREQMDSIARSFRTERS